MGKSRFFPKSPHQLQLGPGAFVDVLVHGILTEKHDHFHGSGLSLPLNAGDGLKVVISTSVDAVEYYSVGPLEVEACASRVYLKNQDVDLPSLELVLHLLLIPGIPVVHYLTFREGLGQLSLQHSNLLHVVAEDHCGQFSIPEVLNGQVQFSSAQRHQLPAIQVQMAPCELLKSNQLSDR